SREYAILGCKCSRQRITGRSMGLVFVCRRYRSSWRGQLSLAAVLTCQSVAVGNRALSWHDAFDQNAQNEICLCDACAVVIYGRGYLLRWVPQDFLLRSATWFLNRRAITPKSGIDDARCS